MSKIQVYPFSQKQKQPGEVLQQRPQTNYQGTVSLPIDVYTGSVDMSRKQITTSYKQKRIIINANNQPRMRHSINLHETTNTTTSKGGGDQQFSKWDGNTTHREEGGNHDHNMMVLHPPQNKFQVFFEQKKTPELQINGIKAIVSSSSRERSPRVPEFFGGPRYYEGSNNNKSISNKPHTKVKQNMDTAQQTVSNNFIFQKHQEKDPALQKEFCLIPIKDLQVNLDRDQLKLVGKKQVMANHQKQNVSKAVGLLTHSDSDQVNQITLYSDRVNLNQAAPLSNQQSNQLQYFKNMKILIENQRRRHSRVHDNQSSTLLIPSDPSLVFKHDYFTLTQSHLTNSKKRSKSRVLSKKNKTVLLIQRSNSKNETNSSQEDNCLSEESLHQIEEDMIMLRAIDKRHRTLNGQTQWKSVARQCPSLIVADKKAPNIAKVNEIKPDNIAVSSTQGQSKTKLRTERLPQVMMNNTLIQKKKYENLNRDLVGVSSTRIVECIPNPQLYPSLMEQVSQIITQPLILKTPAKKRHSFLLNTQSTTQKQRVQTMMGVTNNHNFRVIVNPTSQTPILENAKLRINQTITPFSRLMTGYIDTRFKSRQPYYTNLIQPEVKEVAKETSFDSNTFIQQQPLETQRRSVLRQKSLQLVQPSQNEYIDNSSPSQGDQFFFDPRHNQMIENQNDYLPPSSSQRPNRSTVMSRMPVTQINIRKQDQDVMLRRRRGSVAVQSRNSNVTSRLSHLYPHIMPVQNRTANDTIHSQGFKVGDTLESLMLYQTLMVEQHKQQIHPPRINQRFTQTSMQMNHKTGLKMVESFNRRNTALIQFLKGGKPK